MKLALFDLDHTLIPFDSGMAWTRFLMAKGFLPADADARYLEYCHAYVAGTLDIRAMHRANVAPLAAVDAAVLQQWQLDFGAAIAAQVPAQIPASMRTLVARHRDAGDLCAIVTATSRIVATPMAALFGIGHLLATEPVLDAQGRPNGEIDGEPCYREHKIDHVQRWLRRQGRALADFERSFFYSDSAGDLPLLEAVSDAVAVRPDARLRAHAQASGWPVIDTL